MHEQENLRLRAYELEDTEFIHELVNNPEIMAYWFEEPYYPKAIVEERFQKEKAIHVYKKCGYQTMATLQEEFFMKGSYHNVIVMNIFQRDYFDL